MLFSLHPPAASEVDAAFVPGHVGSLFWISQRRFAFDRPAHRLGAIGIGWRMAPGLALLGAASLLVPIATKRQLYCHNLCPFGAAQQLLKKRLPWKVRVGRKLTSVLQLIPAVLLGLTLCIAMRHWNINLASLEPFNAFVFWIAGPATLIVAVIGLVTAMFVPMAYCRFGCPTGTVLSYLRRRGAAVGGEGPTWPPCCCWPWPCCCD